MDVKRINDFVRNLDSAINITGITVYGVDDEGHSVKIDTEMLANPKPTFTEASTRTNLVGSGELTTTLWGKVKKWFSDLKSVAFSGNYNDLSNTPELKTVATTGVFSDLIDKDVSTGTVTFAEASSRSNIATGESQSTIFGKIKKFFSDLKAVAFSGSYNDLSSKPLSVENSKVKYILSDGTTKLTLIQESELKAVAFSGSYNDLSDKLQTATESSSGLMSAENFKKLNFIHINSGSVNDYLDNGYYYTLGGSSGSTDANNITGKPTSVGGGFLLQVMRFSNYVYQRFVHYNGNEFSRMVFLESNPPDFGVWKTLTNV